MDQLNIKLNSQGEIGPINNPSNTGFTVSGGGSSVVFPTGTQFGTNNPLVDRTKLDLTSVNESLNRPTLTPTPKPSLAPAPSVPRVAPATSQPSSSTTPKVVTASDNDVIRIYGINFNRQPTAEELQHFRTNPTALSDLEAWAPRRAAEMAKEAEAAALAKKNSPAVTANQIVSSSDSVVADENRVKGEVAGLSAPTPNEAAAKKASEDYLKILDDRAAALEKRRLSEIDLINQQFADIKRQTENEQAKERGTTNVALARVGGYLGTQMSAVGVLNNLAQTHRTEIASLEAKKAAAIAAAQNAIDDKQFDIAKAKAQEAKDLIKDINDRRDKFFDQSMKIIEEQRAQDSLEETKKQNAWKNSLETIDRITPTIVESIADMSEGDARNYIQSAAKDLGLDPNLLQGEVNAVLADRRTEEKKSIIELAQKYPGANINPETDNFLAATTKVRGSDEYKLDIARAEADLANTKSLIAERSRSASETKVDFSNPYLKLYTQATGDLVTTNSQARGIIGYADSLLDGKEIVADDYNGTLLDNQVKAKDAQSLIFEAFTNLPKSKGFGEVSDSQVWQWLSTPEAQNYNDDQKKSFIMNAGKNPEDFGIY